MNDPSVKIIPRPPHNQLYATKSIREAIRDCISKLDVLSTALKDVKQ